MSALTPEAAATGDLAAVAAFLYREAELLDGYELEAWLELYAPDATYWIPQGGRETDPRFDVQLMLDDRRRLRERVLRINGGHAYSQDPRSSTVHLVGNVRIAGEEEGALDVRSVQLITELRKGRQLLYSAHVRHLLVPDAAHGFLIRAKEIRLVNNEVPLGNLTFLL
ncbi:aromatic-ring-hydroxylating dioxygenase subunit beta [Conexibacter sp. JD483]|uniref:aromatic-ring-hydroxylating dioxygenase subunit beta n=1 Tax=unclassified Conexibacter TaxID=2627773 RepID=UPI002721DFDB|nr:MULTISPECIES: aromatic-ring-hydroxylating dioxygenase subunit beta [unclassified Conexibacter]MDO8185990.1 aromatic-ring-hydroxylating dioxygenase subunit beta [Conexibacter sp. CPCC 205706]MDO8199480.1 aromatic-ring-hydroxylating dioxygenase subunit beta [Conexibacter sp. CPCC 205762]MDR9368985.1 aromatic-ring-hydroxylating dioxygenase subunit beta [Conexibacter sp. JD483]